MGFSSVLAPPPLKAAGERLGVAGDIPAQTRDQGERVAPVGFHFCAAMVPVARTHD